MRPLLPLLALLLMMGGCASPLLKTPREEDTRPARRRAYERLLQCIEPGMTRRQLYALLPPRRIPQVSRPMIAIGGIYTFSFPREEYPLDRDFSLVVEFRLASDRDIARYLSLQHKSPSSQNMDDELVSRPFLHGPAGPKHQTLHIGMTTRDDLSLKLITKEPHQEFPIDDP